MLFAYVCSEQQQIIVSMKAKTRTVAVINQSNILVIENGQKLVPIKPICEALGIDVDSQRKKINEDEILSSTTVLSTVVAADGKQREMVCIPFKFIFGWLFTINPANVKPEAREAVIQYRLACYNALYQSFTDAQQFLEAKQSMIEEKLNELEEVTNNFKSAKSQMYEKKKELNQIRELTLDQWLQNNRQLELFLREEGSND
jgi:hypothetical protein